MPRQARIDAPGLLHHITARGIERRFIFQDETDYRDFVNRLETSLRKSPNQILAWALMPNHFHLLVRSGFGGVPDLMRRLMTGYAVAFNHRHKRSGHLFQNRYRSVVCEEESYLLELVRYIHLNPMRARLVSSLDLLRKYPWTGHAVLVGTVKHPWQETGEVLGRFGKDLSSARQRYEQFLSEGRVDKRRPDLVGGGLIRSLGGRQATLLARRTGKRQLYDERILGAGDFVEMVLRKVEKMEERQRRLLKEGITIQDMARKIAGDFGVDEKTLYMKGRPDAVSRAKALLIHAGVDYLGISTQAMAELTKMSGPAASKARRRGQGFWDENRLRKLFS
ncbi:MAG: transposase [Elusimicrobia bacterium]|nr:transposase [Elusimicrobiota bacterium]